jgi:RNA polymerase sigma-70 factor (ECF subfamily)
MSDAHHRALLQQVAARHGGSEAAMAQLYKALNASVFGFVRQRLYGADDHAVQEVVVETMYEVWRAADRFGAQSRVLTWVLGIARHKLLDAARRDPSALHDDIDDMAETLADEGPDLLDQLADKQRAQWLAHCMQRLPEDQRESLHLMFVEGLDIAGIAELQACPGGTVKTRVFHAKRKLKDCLARWLRHDGDAAAAQAARP